MKAVVMENTGGRAAVLAEDGTFRNIPDRNYHPGQEIQLPLESSSAARHQAFWNMKRFLATAATFIIVSGAAFGAYMTPFYYVSLDVNPGIILELNYLERVVGTSAINDDAAEILPEMQLKNKKVEEAVALTVERLVESGYLASPETPLVIATSSRNKNREQAALLMNQELETVAREKAEASGTRPSVAAEAVGYEMVQRARELGITPGKLNIITRLLEEEVGENVNEPVKDLMARYVAKRKGGPPQEVLDRQNEREKMTEPSEAAGNPGVEEEKSRNPRVNGNGNAPGRAEKNEQERRSETKEQVELERKIEGRVTQ